MVHSAVLRRMRECSSKDYADAVEVYSQTESRDAEGGTSYTYGLTATFVGKLVGTPSASAERMQSGELVSYMTWRLYLPLEAETKVNAKDRVLVNGKLFEVADTDAGQSDMIELLVTLEEIGRDT
jgi:hypothetical protein